MTEQTKIIVLILSQTATVGLAYAIEAAMGESVKTDFIDSALFALYSLTLITYGFFTENAKKLFIYSTTVTVVTMIFACSDVYFSLNEYQETIKDFYGDSLFIFLSVALGLIFVFSLIFIGLGMALSYLFKLFFRKQADEF